MFNGAKSFNQDLRAWDIENKHKIKKMFHNTESFNQDLASWGVSEFYRGYVLD